LQKTPNIGVADASGRATIPATIPLRKSENVLPWPDRRLEPLAGEVLQGKEKGEGRISYATPKNCPALAPRRLITPAAPGRSARPSAQVQCKSLQVHESGLRRLGLIQRKTR